MYEMATQINTGLCFSYRFSPFCSEDDARAACEARYNDGEYNGYQVVSVSLSKNGKQIYCWS